MLLLVGAALFAGCPHRVEGPDVSTLKDADVKARLEASAARRQTMQGTLKARLPGLQGVVVNATVDVAARAPGDLNVAVRSFFEVPQQVLVAKQGEVTLYDASDGAPRFFRGPANERTLARVLGVPLLPDDAVSLLLSRPPVDVRPGWPLARIKLAGVDEEQGTYTALIERAGRGAVVVVADARDDVLREATVMRGDGRALVSVAFDDVRPVENAAEGAVAFAWKVRLTVKDTGQEVVLELRDASFNAPLADEAFVLEPPEGMPLSPL